jgi:hypothetical protein
MEEAGEDFRNSWTQIVQKNKDGIREFCDKDLCGERLGGNGEDMKPNRLEFDTLVAKIGKSSEMYSAMEVILQIPTAHSQA